MRTITTWCLGVLAAAVMIFPHSVGAGEVVRFGVSIALTGGMWESGNAYLAGVKLRLKEYNRTRGSDDPELEMLVLDDKSDRDTAVANVGLLAKEGVSAIIGPTASAFAVAMRPNAEKYKVVIISPSATEPDISRNKDWVFRILFDDVFQGTAIGDFVTETLGLKRAAVVVNKRFSYGQTVAEAFRQAVEKNGGTIVAAEYYDWDVKDDSDSDLTGLLALVKEADPQVVLLPCYSWEAASILRQAQRVGLDTLFCGGDTWLNENVMLESGNMLEGGYFIAGRDIDSPAPEMRHFVSLYDVSNDPNSRPSSFLGYDALSPLIAAMENGYDGESIRQGLYDLQRFPLASGTISIDPQTGTAKQGYIYQVVFEDDYFHAKFIKEVDP